MRKLALSLFAASFLFAGCKPAKPTESVMLSSDHPTAGETVTLTYDPTGSRLNGKGTPDCIVYLMDDKKNPAVDVDLKPDGQLFKGSFTIPANTKLIAVKLYRDTTVDNNKKQGYPFPVYKDDKPVSGAYAMKENLYAGQLMYDDKLKLNVPAAIAAMQKEFELHPETKKDYETRYAYLLTRYKAPDSKSLLQKTVTEMAASGNEKLMSDAAGIMAFQKNVSGSDSLKKILHAKFPKEMAKSDMDDAFNKEEDPAKMEAIYNAYVQNSNNLPLTAEEKDGYITGIIYADIIKANFTDCDRLMKLVSDENELPATLNDAGWANAHKGKNLPELAKLSKLSMDIIAKNAKNPKPQPFESKKALQKAAKSDLDMYSDTYAYILSKMGKYDEAYQIELPVYANFKGENSEVNETYTDILEGLHKDKDAQVAIEDAVKKGNASAKMSASLKGLYTKTNGSDKGYDQYFAALKTEYLKNMKEKLTKEMLNQPAPAFTLKDFDGKTVSLASLKGKTVVVDFWATWCGPCKASFPGMQKAVTKYKDNPNVQFVFVDTWENGDSYLPLAKKFIADNKYTFHVLEDEKGDDGRQSKVVGAYEVTGIPTKFIIDGNGKIRFKKVGGGADDNLVDEISTMIDITANAGLNNKAVAALK